MRYWKSWWQFGKRIIPLDPYAISQPKLSTRWIQRVNDKNVRFLVKPGKLISFIYHLSFPKCCSHKNEEREAGSYSPVSHKDKGRWPQRSQRRCGGQKEPSPLQSEGWHRFCASHGSTPERNQPVSLRTPKGAHWQWPWRPRSWAHSKPRPQPAASTLFLCPVPQEPAGQPWQNESEGTPGPSQGWDEMPTAKDIGTTLCTGAPTWWLHPSSQDPHSIEHLSRMARECHATWC